MPRPKKPITKGSRRNVTKTSPKRGTGTAKAYTPRKKAASSTRTAPVMRSENVAQFRATTAKAPSMPTRKGPTAKQRPTAESRYIPTPSRRVPGVRKASPAAATATKTAATKTATRKARPATATGQLAKRGLKGNVRTRTTASPSPRGRSYTRQKPTKRTTTRRKSTRFRNI